MIGLRRVVTLAVLIITSGSACPSLKPLTFTMTHTVPQLSFRSSAFQNGCPIPSKHTGDGLDVSPELEWSGGPEGTKSFALVVEDPDAPQGTWVHWVLWNLPASTSFLPEAVERKNRLPRGARTGINDFGCENYGGPAPPRGKPHHYLFKLYALDTMLPLKVGSAKQALDESMTGHILAKGMWIGTYLRK